MPTPADVIVTYIAAKDGNRPWLMARAFAPDATLATEVRSEAISFPSDVSGREAITETLVSGFCRNFENVYTFCLIDPPDAGATTFSCDWLVGMSAPGTGDLRVGCGRYHWTFAGTSGRASRLAITIEVMEILPPATLVPVMQWLDALPYPWCPADRALAEVPPIAELAKIKAYLPRR